MDKYCEDLIDIKNNLDGASYAEVRSALSKIEEECKMQCKDLKQMQECLRKARWLYQKAESTIVGYSNGKSNGANAGDVDKEGGIDMGQFIGYLSFGAEGIIDDGTGGFFILYDGPTLSSKGEQYFFSDLYKQYGVEPYGSLQSFGGAGSVLNKENKAITYGNQVLDPKKGTLEYGGIERYAIAIGPKLQNPNCDLSKKLDPKEMAYGTCVDISIELDGKTYYIPAIITDVKAHSAPSGIFQTGVPFDGSGNESTGKSGPTVEWYVIQGKGDADKTKGLNQFNNNASITIYREEVLK